MLEFKLAYRNLISAGLRTGLNIAALSITYVFIIWIQGIFVGELKQTLRYTIREEIAGGQYWYKTYDPYDPISFDESHGAIPSELQNLIEKGQATPILIRQASIYPGGRVKSIFLKGIVPTQRILEIPSDKLVTEENTLPILIGRRMAVNNSLKIGDYLTISFKRQ